jgi:SAM-dependent methyltransferase
MLSRYIADQMRHTYDRYFSGQGYRRRYPRPNEATLDYLLANGAREAARILDFGCGNGRYALALLALTPARVTAYDISGASLREFEHALARTPHADRVCFVHDDLAALTRTGPHDLALLLFGVLSHLGDRAARIDALRRLRMLLHDDGRLILSVPSRRRRRPFDLARCGLMRALARARPPLDEPGSVAFTRRVAGEALTFFYHLYTVQELRDELEIAGFALRHCEAESLLPEWCVTRSPRLARLDRALARRLPPALGYGIRVLAVAV